MQKVFQNKVCFALFQTEPRAENVRKQTVLHYFRLTHMQKVFQNKPCFALFKADPHAESVPKQSLSCTISGRPTRRKCSETNPVLHYFRQMTHTQKVFQNKPCFALFQTNDLHAESVPSDGHQRRRPAVRGRATAGTQEMWLQPHQAAGEEAGHQPRQRRRRPHQLRRVHIRLPVTPSCGRPKLGLSA